MVSGRYRRVERIGGGASGEVWSAIDELRGAEVALKLLSPIDVASRVRVQREVRALRLLQVPGVVRLLDEGEEDGQVYIVMERVHGAPFPGADVPRTWAGLRGRVLELFDVLGRVHGLGVVHRDLKPENVLVNREGRVVVLDFGLARSEDFGGTVTLPQALLGTVRYMSPEQFDGPPADARSDLYSAALMVVEALTGRLPHLATGGLSLLAERASRDAVPIREIAPGVPSHVSAVLDSLLRRDPDERAADAETVIAALRGDTQPGAARPMPPWIGPTGPIDEAVARIEAGRAVVVDGPARSGRTRLLVEVAERLAARGRDVVWLPPGRRPFSSLIDVIGADPDLLDVRERMERRLADRLAAGAVLVVDDVDRIDRWSMDLLERTEGRIIRVGEAHDAIRLEDLTETELATCFAGPERLLHVPSQAAYALFDRAGGRRGRVVAELAGWERAGLCHTVGGRWEMAPGGLERLAGGLAVEPESSLSTEPPRGLGADLSDLLRWISLAWPHTEMDALAGAMDVAGWEVELGVAELERLRLVRRGRDDRIRALTPATSAEPWHPERVRQAHRTLAARLPPGAVGRLRHLIAGEVTLEAAVESTVVADTRRQEGDPTRALAVAQIGLRLLRDEDGEELRARLLTALIRAALLAATPRAHAEAIYEVRRATEAHPETRLDAGVATMLSLAEAAHAFVTGQRDALERIREVAPLPDAELEAQRLILLATSELRRDPNADARIAEIRKEAERCPLAERVLAHIDAATAYRRSDPAGAAAANRRAASLETTATGRARALVGAAAALLEAGDYAGASALAVEATPEARRCGSAVEEARAEWVRRCADFRAGRPMVIDTELLEVVAGMGMPWLDAQISMNEAAIAWRLGDASQARILATRAAEAWRQTGFTGGETLVRALAWAAGGLPCPALLPAVQATSADGLAAQALGLGLLATRELRDREVDEVLRRELWRRLNRFAHHPASHHLEVLSVGELRTLAATP